QGVAHNRSGAGQGEALTHEWVGRHATTGLRLFGGVPRRRAGRALGARTFPPLRAPHRRGAADCRAARQHRARDARDPDQSGTAGPGKEAGPEGRGRAAEAEARAAEARAAARIEARAAAGGDAAATAAATAARGEAEAAAAGSQGRAAEAAAAEAETAE